MRGWVALIAVSLSACGQLPPVQSEDASVDAGPYRCSPMTCAGCCRDNVCLSGEELLACGYDGRACRQCGQGTVCVSPGTCASVATDGGVSRPYNPDAGLPTNPFTGTPLVPPMQECIPIFGGFFCD